jgi:hypothetical protein
MINATMFPNSSIRRPRFAALVAIALSITFLSILALLHFLEPEFDPLWRMISEYELGNYGWIMVLAFFCWGASTFALLTAIWPALRAISGAIGRWWLVLIGVAEFGGGVFKTNPITDPTVNTADTLHLVCGAIIIFTFPLAASLVANSLARNQTWKPARGLLLWATLLAWFGLIVFFGSIIISNIIHPGAGKGGPDVLMGLPNRFMVITYHIWLITAALTVIRVSKHKGA